MSKIKQMIESLKETDAFETAKDAAKISVTLKLDAFTVWQLDYVAKHFGIKRTPFSVQLMEEAAFDAMESLGVDMDEQKCLFIAEISGRKIEDVRKDWAKTGFFFNEESK